MEHAGLAFFSLLLTRELQISILEEREDIEIVQTRDNQLIYDEGCALRDLEEVTKPENVLRDHHVRHIADLPIFEHSDQDLKSTGSGPLREDDLKRGAFLHPPHLILSEQGANEYRRVEDI